MITETSSPPVPPNSEWWERGETTPGEAIITRSAVVPRVPTRCGNLSRFASAALDVALTPRVITPRIPRAPLLAGCRARQGHAARVHLLLRLTLLERQGAWPALLLTHCGWCQSGGEGRGIAQWEVFRSALLVRNIVTSFPRPPLPCPSLTASPSPVTIAGVDLSPASP